MVFSPCFRELNILRKEGVRLRAWNSFESDMEKRNSKTPELKNPGFGPFSIFASRERIPEGVLRFPSGLSFCPLFGLIGHYDHSGGVGAVLTQFEIPEHRLQVEVGFPKHLK